MTEYGFLDYDGVLNTMVEAGRRPLRHAIKPACVESLNALCERRPNLLLVISSSWRIGRTMNALIDPLVDNGFQFAHRIGGTTPVIALGLDRAQEIEDWLDRVGGKDAVPFVILDDEASAVDGLRRHLIQTNRHVGLTQELASDACKVLERQRRTLTAPTQKA